MHNKIKLARDSSWNVRVLWTLNISWDVIADALESGDYEGIRSVLDELRVLREDQEKGEAVLFGGELTEDNRNVAIKLVALYHWLKATEMTIKIILGEIDSSTDDISYHFDRAISAATGAGDVDLTDGLRIIKVAARSIAAAHEMT